MTFPGLVPNFGRQARLAQLAPVDAARALLDGDFGIGDEPAICFALRRDPRVTLDDDAILDVLRLSRAMTYKSAAAGLPLGAGEGVIVADPRSD